MGRGKRISTSPALGSRTETLDPLFHVFLAGSLAKKDHLLEPHLRSLDFVELVNLVNAESSALFMACKNFFKPDFLRDLCSRFDALPEETRQRIGWSVPPGMRTEERWALAVMVLVAGMETNLLAKIAALPNTTLLGLTQRGFSNLLVGEERPVLQHLLASLVGGWFFHAERLNRLAQQQSLAPKDLRSNNGFPNLGSNSGLAYYFWAHHPLGGARAGGVAVIPAEDPLSTGRALERAALPPVTEKAKAQDDDSFSRQQARQFWGELIEGNETIWERIPLVCREGHIIIDPGARKHLEKALRDLNGSMREKLHFGPSQDINAMVLHLLLGGTRKGVRERLLGIARSTNAELFESVTKQPLKFPPGVSRGGTPDRELWLNALDEFTVGMFTLGELLHRHQQKPNQVTGSSASLRSYAPSAYAFWYFQDEGGRRGSPGGKPAFYSWEGASHCMDILVSRDTRAGNASPEGTSQRVVIPQLSRSYDYKDDPRPLAWTTDSSRASTPRKEKSHSSTQLTSSREIAVPFISDARTKKPFFLGKMGLQPRTFDAAALERSGERTMHEVYNKMSRITLFGGPDIPRQWYDSAVTTNESTARDRVEERFARWALEQEKPLAGICRGMQLLNVVAGGSLHVELRDAYPHADADLHRHGEHPVRVDPTSRLAQRLGLPTSDVPTDPETWPTIVVPSSHHQCVREVADGFRIVAVAPDGVIEAIEHVECPDRYWGVQFHPERNATDPRLRRLTEAFLLGDDTAPKSTESPATGSDTA